MIPTWSAACYAIGSMVQISNINTLKSIYYAYFNSIIKYGIIFWSNSSNSGKIFTLQTKIITIMADAQTRTSRTSLFKQLKILSVPCQYTLSLMSFILNNQEIFQIHLYTILIQGISFIFTGQMPTFLVFKKVHSMLAPAFSTVLPPSARSLKNYKAKFKAAKHLQTNSFYSVDKFFTCKDDL